MLQGISPCTAMYAVVIALASRSGGASGASPQSSEQDVCIFYQKTLRLRSMSLLTHEYAANAKWRAESLVSGDVKPTKPNDEATVDVTTDGNATVVVDVDNDADVVSNATKHGDNVTANVTRDTKEVKIEHKVIDDQGKRHTVDTSTKTEKTTGKNESTDDTGNETEKPEEKALAKENITVHKHTLNITRRMNSTHNETQNVKIKETIKTVDVASPFHIASIYMILFVPVLVAWALYYHHGQQAQHYMWLLPFTMCTMSIGQDLVNQSLTLILMAPNAITAIQAFSMSIGTCVWAVCMNWSDLRALSSRNFSKVTSWLGVAVFFSIYQVMNHLVYAMCSLSERTIITSLSPLVVLALERLIFSEALKPRVTFHGKIALALMVAGALLFSIQSPSFTLDGLGIASVLLLATVPYRLAQRQFLAEGPEFPLAVLACIDGFMLGVPSLSISAVRNGHLWTDFPAFTETSICFMLGLSIVTFVGLHICTLAMLRLGSATTYLVFANVASLATIALGIFFFGDAALGTTLACIGLTTNVASGMWYSVEVQSNGEAWWDKPDKDSIERINENQSEPKRAITAG